MSDQSDTHHPVRYRPEPGERIDPRDFLSPEARAVAYLDLDDSDGARRTLSGLTLHRLRRLGEHFDRLSMICFELAAPGHHLADDEVAVPADPPVDRRKDLPMSERPMTDCGACGGDGGPSLAQQCIVCAGSGKVPEPIECTACAGEGGSNVFERCTTCEGAGVLIPCAKCEGAHPVGHPAPAAPVERVDPRDFLDQLVALAVAYLDLDDLDSARRTLASISLDRLRRLGEHYDRLSMICFELASAAHHTPDDAVDPAAFRAGPDEVPAHPGRPVQAAPVVDFEVDDLDDLGHADTSERNLP